MRCLQSGEKKTKRLVQPLLVMCAARIVSTSNVNFMGRGAPLLVLFVVGVPRMTCLKDRGSLLNRASIPVSY
jgi:hypothetical protein